MRQLIPERNKELASLMMKHQRGKLTSADKEALQLALTRFNARSSGNRRRATKQGPIDWESGKDARAEGHIARATKGV